MAIPHVFETARLRADRLTPSHFPELVRFHRDAAAMAHLGGVRDDEQTAAYLARNLQHWDDYGFGLWIVSEIGGGDPIGRGVLRHLRVDDVDEIEVGYGFYPERWGRGFATEIATACLALGREHLALDTAVALTSPANLASQRVLRKCGLAYERDYVHEGALSALYRVRWPSLPVPEP